MHPASDSFPPPSPAAQALSEALSATIRGEIAACGGWLAFERFMDLALYAPGLGYYSAGSTKLGPAGDFVTAPEVSPLFGRCVARQLREVAEHGFTEILEIGGGSGALAAQVLGELARSHDEPDRYLILEVSAELKERQRSHIAAAVPDLADRVEWIDCLSAHTRTLVIANEVLDAIPTRVVRAANGTIEELGVTVTDVGDSFEPRYRPAAGELLTVAQSLHLPDGYETEINLRARAFTRTLANAIERGVIFFVDYGYTAADYYHSQRSRGTLMCHYRHHAHEDPFTLVGLQDITSHVDFTATADAALEVGMEVLGYTTQAAFLINCGITDMLAELDSADLRSYAPVAGQAQKLLSPAQMGERFKVLALAKGVSIPLTGFARGDRTHTL
jgi:SAM-dependent MidA family methyltransferase